MLAAFLVHLHFKTGVMQIDRALVDHLANLSKLYFTDEEKETMQQDLAKMIGFVEKLNELDTTGVEPMRHMSQVQDVFRNDVAAAPMHVKEALENAAVHGEEFFMVPKVFS
jgi:aspartyl-tRNA(Asn)/glutamyl-tRNA(Gln) amidotransferase subunit C